MTVQERRGDETIAQELALLPAFAIATTNTGTTTEPITDTVQVPDGDISTLLTVNDVDEVAGGVGYPPSRSTWDPWRNP